MWGLVDSIIFCAVCKLGNSWVIESIALADFPQRYNRNLVKKFFKATKMKLCKFYTSKDASFTQTTKVFSTPVIMRHFACMVRTGLKEAQRGYRTFKQETKVNTKVQ